MSVGPKKSAEKENIAPALGATKQDGMIMNIAGSETGSDPQRLASTLQS
jgi:hypothetical protein